MATRLRHIANAAAALVIGTVAALAIAVPANAAVSTATAFTAPLTVEAEFGSDWFVPITVTMNGTERSLGSSDGTIDIFVEGISGAYASSLPLFPGGSAYFSQPSDTAPLGAGVYRITAIFQPAAGSELQTSQTQEPLILTVTPLDLIPAVDFTADPSVVTAPTVNLTLGGEYVETFGGAPGGEWTVTVTDGKGEVLFEKTVPQPAGSTDPVSIAIIEKMEPGSDYDIAALFAPDLSVAAGLTVATPPVVAYRAPDAAPFAGLVSPVTVPLWSIVTGGAVLVVLAAAAIVLAIILARRRRDADQDVAEEVVELT